jgi:hypothetical protein
VACAFIAGNANEMNQRPSWQDQAAPLRHRLAIIRPDCVLQHFAPID